MLALISLFEILGFTANSGRTLSFREINLSISFALPNE